MIDSFRIQHDPSSEDETHPVVYEVAAISAGRQIGELRYAQTRKTSFLLGVAVRYEHLRRGVASALLEEWESRSGQRELLANVDRENTAEGAALLGRFERSRGAIRRIDTGLDGD